MSLCYQYFTTVWKLFCMCVCVVWVCIFVYMFTYMWAEVHAHACGSQRQTSGIIFGSSTSYPLRLRLSLKPRAHQHLSLVISLFQGCCLFLQITRLLYGLPWMAGTYKVLGIWTQTLTTNTSTTDHSSQLPRLWDKTRPLRFVLPCWDSTQGLVHSRCVLLAVLTLLGNFYQFLNLSFLRYFLYSIIYNHRCIYVISTAW